MVRKWNFPNCKILGTISVTYQLTLLAWLIRTLGQTQYLYNLQGLDTTWSQTNQISVNYNALPPGAYTFRVKTVDGTGEESEIYELASISIRPATLETDLVSGCRCVAYPVSGDGILDEQDAKCQKEAS